MQIELTEEEHSLLRMSIVKIEQPGNGYLDHWEVCGRKFGTTTSIK